MRVIFSVILENQKIRKCLFSFVKTIFGSGGLAGEVVRQVSRDNSEERFQPELFSQNRFPGLFFGFQRISCSFLTAATCLTWAGDLDF